MCCGDAAVLLVRLLQSDALEDAAICGEACATATRRLSCTARRLPCGWGASYLAARPCPALFPKLVDEVDHCRPAQPWPANLSGSLIRLYLQGQTDVGGVCATSAATSSTASRRRRWLSVAPSSPIFSVSRDAPQVALAVPWFVCTTFYVHAHIYKSCVTTFSHLQNTGRLAHSFVTCPPTCFHARLSVCLSVCLSVYLSVRATTLAYPFSLCEGFEEVAK